MSSTLASNVSVNYLGGTDEKTHKKQNQEVTFFVLHFMRVRLEPNPDIHRKQQEGTENNLEERKRKSISASVAGFSVFCILLDLTFPRCCTSLVQSVKKHTNRILLNYDMESALCD